MKGSKMQAKPTHTAIRLIASGDMPNFSIAKKYWKSSKVGMSRLTTIKYA